jgi:hypothetical protein
MKNVKIVCASLMSLGLFLGLATSAFADEVKANVENPPVTNVISSDTTEYMTTAAVCPCGVAGSPSSLVAANKGQTTQDPIHPSGPAVQAPAGGAGNAEKTTGH